MCGIVGYSGKKQASPILLNGLKRLEYRGYDSSGIAVIDPKKGIDVIKAKGRLSELVNKTDNGALFTGTVGIGHTRWATHGVPNDTNSHPHISDNGHFAVVHNGIIENFESLRNELKSRGFTFNSDTDTEVIVQLLQYYYCGDMLDALRRVMNKLQGSYAVGILCSKSPDTLYAIRKDNPLVVGLGKGENFIASDIPALLEHTRKFVLLNDGEIVALTPDSATFFNRNAEIINKETFTVDWDVSDAEKDGYPHFMLKEIYAQPKALTDTLRPRIKDGKIVPDKISFSKQYVDGLRNIDIIGCGSAYHAGIVGKHFIEKYCRIRVNCDLASEYIYRKPISDSHTLTIIISQSGETADTLAALRLAKSLGSHTISVVNVIASSIAREADDVLYTLAGPEIAVATTKGYTTQVAALYLLGLYLADIKGTITNDRYADLVNELVAMPEKVKAQLDNITDIQFYATQYFTNQFTFFIGRGTDYAASLEGALKLKEISYVHAEAYAAGELKHGTISLIEEGILTIALVTQSDLAAKTISNIQSVKARGGTVLAVASPKNTSVEASCDYTVYIPDCDDDISPVLTAIALQLYSYYVAAARGCDIDKPRNLAKSVTVE